MKESLEAGERRSSPRNHRATAMFPFRSAGTVPDFVDKDPLIKRLPCLGSGAHLHKNLSYSIGVLSTRLCKVRILKGQVCQTNILTNLPPWETPIKQTPNLTVRTAQAPCLPREHDVGAPSAYSAPPHPSPNVRRQGGTGWDKN